jgi:hypothetical protein
MITSVTLVTASVCYSLADINITRRHSFTAVSYCIFMADDMELREAFPTSEQDVSADESIVHAQTKTKKESTAASPAREAERAAWAKKLQMSAQKRNRAWYENRHFDPTKDEYWEYFDSGVSCPARDRSVRALSEDPNTMEGWVNPITGWVHPGPLKSSATATA